MTHTPVVVVGGGAAGLGCALAAASGGLDVVLLERADELGGTVQHALIHTIGGLFDDRGELLNPGLPAALCERLGRACAHTRKRRIGRTWVLGVDPAVYARVLADWIGEARNLRVLRQASLTELSADGDRIAALHFTHGGESRVVRPHAVVDATGAANVVRLLGAHRVVDGDALAGLVVALRGVAPEALQFPRGVALLRHIRKAVDAGELPPECATLWLDTGTYPDEVYVKFNLTAAAYAPRRWIDVMERLLAWLHSTPGFAAACIARYGRLGIRDGGRIVGEYCLTEADVVAGRRFADVACRAAWPIEHWHPETGLHLEYLPDGQDYDIPLRSLKVMGFTNLWAAGKCLSAEPRAQASARVAGTCWAMGEAVARHILAGSPCR
jgi:glycine/D-amino acid oxidase-like deaminating enzyme